MTIKTYKWWIGTAVPMTELVTPTLRYWSNIPLNPPNDNRATHLTLPLAAITLKLGFSYIPSVSSKTLRLLVARQNGDKWQKDGLNTDRQMVAYSSKCKTTVCVIQTRDIRHLPRWASEAWKLYSDTLDVMIQTVKICTRDFNSFFLLFEQ